MLCRKSGIKVPTDIAENAGPLLFRSNFIHPPLLLINVVAQTKFSTENESLLHESALFATVKRSPANLIALVADHRIRIKTGLPRLSHGLRINAAACRRVGFAANCKLLELIEAAWLGGLQSPLSKSGNVLRAGWRLRGLGGRK